MNQNGEFMIFGNEESPQLSCPKSIGHSFVTDMSYQFEINSVGPATPHLKTFDDAADAVLTRLEPNFKKLNKNNKINILLKALIMERNKNQEQVIKIEVLKREYTEKVKLVASLQNETEQLIDQVAQCEIQIDKKQEDFDYLWQKHMEDKAKLDQQAEKIASFERSLIVSQRSEASLAKDVEDRIDLRVKKIIDQERELLN